ncbi:MAG: ATP-dependent helicase [Eubacterium sp.]|nr:ATP-dependent helicase [Eubacterium sp.]
MFNKSQLEAICFNEGPAIVLAGPGSGKTTVITHRVKNLIERCNVPPEEILVVTFTKAAAVSMSKRFHEIAGRSYPVTFGTFHSAFFKILRTEQNYKGDCILTDYSRAQILQEIALRCKVDVPSMKDYVQNMSDEISYVKGNLVSLEKYISKNFKSDTFRLVYEEYEKSKVAENKIDFEDMLEKTYTLLTTHPELLTKWQEVFKYVLIDEFQDINSVQYEIIKMLAAPQNNIFIVGDDDQSIYGFRGSKPEIMFKFTEDYASATKIYLSDNYRSTPEIVIAAGNVIKNNKKRFKKKIKSAQENGESVDIRVFKNQGDEISKMCEMIRKYVKSGIPETDIAVLVRTNGQIPTITQTLQNELVKNQTKSQGRGIYKGNVGRDIAAYIGAALKWESIPINENGDLVYVLNKPARYISRQVITQSGMTIDGLLNVYSHNEMMKREIESLDFHMKMIRTLNPYAAINYIKNAAGYESYLREYARTRKTRLSNMLFQLDKIQEESEQYDSLEDWLDYALSRQGEDAEGEPFGVNVLTMHSSKGLEFEVVFILDANQGIIPSSKAVRSRDYEEERRLFYVAMTRAAKFLHIFCANESLGYPMEPSMFVDEIER